jgi:predicted secreted Zn-dependent protease
MSEKQREQAKGRSQTGPQRTSVRPVAANDWETDQQLAGLSLVDGSPLHALPDLPNTQQLRRSVVLQAQRNLGNTLVQRALKYNTVKSLAPPKSQLRDIVQRRNGRRRRGANPGGRGPGTIRNASETTYDVSGATLDEITGQLNGIDGFASATNTPLGLAGQVTPQRQLDDSYQVTVAWRINEATVQLPRWADYDAACPAAQQEWDRFMRQTRQHEQEAHVNTARDFVNQLGEEDNVIRGATVEELQANLSAKQQELAEQLQAIHDACDHGVGIDAILHPDNGHCDEE